MILRTEFIIWIQYFLVYFLPVHFIFRKALFQLRGDSEFREFKEFKEFKELKKLAVY